MAAHTPVKLGTRLLKAEFDGTEHSASISNLTIEAAEADGDFTSFADAAAGGAMDWILKFTIAQDLTDGSLWRQMWDNPGSTVPVTIRPQGNAAPTATEPHFVGSAVITIPSGTVLGGEANKSATAVMTVELEWKFTGKPVLTSA